MRRMSGMRIAGVVLALVLIGCGPSTPEPEEPGGGGGAPEPEPGGGGGTPEPEPGGGGSGGDEGTIVVGEDPCTADADCVPAACCHAAACVGRASAGAPNCA